MITVNNVNEAPTDITLDNLNVAENAAGAVIGNLGVTDPDTGDTHSWSVNDARFEVVGTQLKLKTGQSLNFESEPTVNLTITATDLGGAGLSYNEPFVITVIDVNEVPQVGLNNIVTFMTENVNTATGVRMADILISDDGLGSNVLSLSGADASMFEVVGTELWLKAGSLLDHETNGTLNVTVSIDDTSLGGTPDDSAPMATIVGDVNESPTDITLDNATISENIAGAIVGNLSVTDEDSGDTHTWSVNDVRFEVVGTQLKLKAGQSLNFESEPTVNLTITATDLGGAGLSYNEPFVITVNNANEAPTDITLDNLNVAENAAGAVIGNLGATDPDAGDTHTWSVNDARFEVVGTQLKLKAGQSLNFESEPTVNLTITATDLAGAGLSYNEPFLITVNNVNEAPTDITLDNLNVAENAAGAVIGNLGVTDPDTGDTHSWSVNDARFEVVGTQLKLKAGQSLNFESEPTVNLTITATDLGGAGLSYNEPFLITVNNVNEAPTDITLDNLNVAENAAGAVIGNLGVTDPDAGDTHSWSVNDARFEVVGTQLKLKAGQSLNFESEPTVNLTITATDLGGAGFSYNEPFVIAVSNVNEAPNDITLDNLNVAENAAGAVIGNLGVTDPDAGDTHSWSVNDARFEVVGTQLKLKAGQSLNFESEPTVNLTITATDLGGAGLSYNEPFVITVNNANEAPTDITLDNLTVTENAAGAVIGNLGVTDPDTGDTHSWSVNDARFEVVGTQLKLKTGQSLNFESEPTVNLTITATDLGGAGFSYNEPFVIAVSNVNEAPNDITLDNLTVTENAAGAVIGNLGVTDPDTGDTHSWSVNDARFEVVGTQLKLKAGQSLDFASEPTVNLTITATDLGGAGLSYNEPFAITVNSVNKAPTDITLDNLTVTENAAGAVIGNLGVTDPDTGDTHSWSVNDARFEVVGTQLKLKAGQSLDFETEPTVNLTITATDLGGAGLSYNEPFVITVNNVNEAPTDITLDNLNVAENATGAVIGNLGVTDPDTGDTHSWSVNDARFEVVGTQLKLKASQSLDFETEPTVNLTITATDLGGAGLSYNEPYVITVNNVNEAPTDITLDNLTVAENAAGAVIGNLGATDPDAGDTHSWSVNDARFEVVGTQLKLKAGQSLDFETEPTVNLTITATDLGGAGLSYNEPFLISVNNFNEAPTDITLDNLTVTENAAGAVIGNLGVADPDTGDTHSWSVNDVPV